MDAAANEINRNLGPGFSMTDAFDVEFIETADVEDVDMMTTALAEWFNV